MQPAEVIAQIHAYVSEGNRPAAISIAKIGLGANPQSAALWTELGKLHFDLGEVNEAKSALNSASQMSNTPGEAFDYLGRIAEVRGQVDNAVELYHRALAIDVTLSNPLDRLTVLGKLEPTHAPRSATTSQPLAKSLDEANSVGSGELLRTQRRLIRSIIPALVIPAVFAIISINVLDGGATSIAESIAGDRPPGTVVSDCFAENTGFEATRACGRLQVWQTSVDTARSVLTVIAFILLAVSLVAAFNALLATFGTKYDFYEHRIDITRGGLRRTQSTVWLFQLTDVTTTQGISDALVNSSQINLHVDSTSPATIAMPGVGSRSEAEEIWTTLRNTAIVEKRSMHKWWF